MFRVILVKIKYKIARNLKEIELDVIKESHEDKRNRLIGGEEDVRIHDQKFLFYEKLSANHENNTIYNIY